MKLKFMSLLLLSAFLVGCKSYRISEARVNEAMVQRIKEQPEQHIALSMGEQTLTLNMLIKAIEVDLLAAHGGVANIHVATDMTGTLTMFGRQIALTTELIPNVQAGLEMKDGGIYLVEPKLLGLQVQGSSFNDQLLRSALGPVQTDFEVALAGYFAANPVYVLDHSALERSAALVVKQISIEDDAIEVALF